MFPSRSGPGLPDRPVLRAALWTPMGEPLPNHLAAALTLLVALVSPTPAPVAHVVLIGVPGLEWSDVGPTATPNLWRLADRAAAGVLSVKTVGTRTCPNDGWATVS